MNKVYFQVLYYKNVLLLFKYGIVDIFIFKQGLLAFINFIN